MKCELCWADLNDDNMVSHGEFFVCEKCDDVSAAKQSAADFDQNGGSSLDELKAELETKH